MATEPEKKKFAIGGTHLIISDDKNGTITLNVKSDDKEQRRAIRRLLAQELRDGNPSYYFGHDAKNTQIFYGDKAHSAELKSNGTTPLDPAAVFAKAAEFSAAAPETWEQFEALKKKLNTQTRAVPADISGQPTIALGNAINIGTGVTHIKIAGHDVTTKMESDGGFTLSSANEDVITVLQHVADDALTRLIVHGVSENRDHEYEFKIAGNAQGKNGKPHGDLKIKDDFATPANIGKIVNHVAQKYPTPESISAAALEMRGLQAERVQEAVASWQARVRDEATRDTAAKRAELKALLSEHGVKISDALGKALDDFVVNMRIENRRG